MPAAPTDSPPPDLESLAAATQEEQARQGFCSALRAHAIQTMAGAMERDYRAVAQRGDDARAIARRMAGRASYRFYSAVRYNAQEMCFRSVQPQVERALPALIAAARDLAERRPAGGSLRLDAGLAMPDYALALDVHLTPGSFHSEYTADDVAQGAVTSLGARVFTAQQQHRRWGGVAKVIARWLQAEHPGFRPLRMLDIGTGSGKNLLPYAQAFPGIEAHGVDIAAPLLRYGHALAEQEGVALHFSQQDAAALDYPDGYFDLIVSSFFFHEVPLGTTRAVLAQCRRLLRPGGMMVHQEMPASHLVDPYEDFFWNWDTANNNEPFCTIWRAQDHAALCVEAGFDAAGSFALILPDPGAYPHRTAAFAWDEAGRPRHGRGGWYVFGGVG